MVTTPERRRRYRRLALSVAIAAALAAETPAGRAIEPTDGWEALEPGLDLGTFAAPQPAETGDSRIRVLRIDPQRFQLRLLNASATPDGQVLTPGEWCRRHNLTAAINASMFQVDYRTSVSLMKTRRHTNNPWLSKDKAVLAFDPLSGDDPPVQIIDRTCQDFDAVRSRYGTLVQSIRMVSCDRQNVWSVQKKKWSTAAIGVDRQGRPLFIHVRSPYPTHDLIEMLLALPIDLQSAMYAEGGAQAQLHIVSGDHEFAFVGSHDTGIGDSDALRRSWPIPNVLGVVRRGGPAETGGD